jgi:hypothetical protein
MNFSKNQSTWGVLFYGNQTTVEQFLNSRKQVISRTKSAATTCNSFEHTVSCYLHTFPVSNKAYRNQEQGTYTNDLYLQPKTDEHGDEIIILAESEFIDYDNYDDFEDMHVDYNTEDDFVASSSSEDEEEWNTI